MVRHNRAWAIGAGLLASLALPLSFAGTASARSTPPTPRAAAQGAHWRKVYTVRNSEISGISATSARNAWAIGDWRTTGEGPSNGLLRRWDGHRWRVMSYPHRNIYVPMSVSALSPTDLWMFVQDTRGARQLLALHWENGAWSTLALPVDPGPMLVLSDSDIWMAGGTLPGCYSVTDNSQGCSVASHWDGHQWTSYRVATYSIAGFAGTSPSNVWAVGESWLHHTGSTTSFRPYIFRWNGAAWRRTSLQEHRTYWDPSIAAVSARDVWVGEQSPRQPRTCAMRWNGRRWTAFRVRASLQPDCADLHTDYRHGMWFGPFLHWTGKRFIAVPSFRPLRYFGTNGFRIATVPGGSSPWLYGLYQYEGTRIGPPIGVIAALR